MLNSYASSFSECLCTAAFPWAWEALQGSNASVLGHPQIRFWCVISSIHWCFNIFMEFDHQFCSHGFTFDIEELKRCRFLFIWINLNLIHMSPRTHLQTINFQWFEFSSYHNIHPGCVQIPSNTRIPHISNSVDCWYVTRAFFLLYFSLQKRSRDGSNS